MHAYMVAHMHACIYTHQHHIKFVTNKLLCYLECVSLIQFFWGNYKKSTMTYKILEQSCMKKLPYSTEQLGFISKLFIFILLLTKMLNYLLSLE